MNYVLLFGIALFFVLMSVRDGAPGGSVFRDGRLSFRLVTDDYTLRVKGRGDVELAPDASGVTALSRSGSLDVRMTRGDDEARRVLFTNVDGTVREQFFVGADEQSFGPDAERFVAEVMPIVLRETALNADERIAWLVANRGQAGLLEEIELIQADFAQRVYTVRYAETSAIAEADFQRLMRAVEDHMSSDFDVRTTLQAAYDAQSPAGESLTALLAAGRTMSSDFDARTLLEHVAGGIVDSPQSAAAYLDLAATISSDFDLRLALQPLLTRESFADEAVARAMELGGRELSSDFDLRTLLAAGAGRVGASDVLARAYTSAAGSISSDFEQREALTALAHDAELTRTGWTLLLEAAQSIHSDFDTATLLATVAPSLPRDDAVEEAYRAALQTIDSDFDRSRAAAALADSREPSNR